MRAPSVSPALRGGLILILCGVLLALLLAKSFGKFDTVVPGSVVLDTAGGALETGAEIKLAGVVVGEVSQIRPADDGVRLDLEFEPEQAKTVPSPEARPRWKGRVSPLNIR